MDFGNFFNPPEPEKLIEAMDRLKDAYRKAAEAETGDAQPLFQKQYEAFVELIDNAGASQNPQDMLKGLLPQVQLQFQLNAAAKQNPAAAQAQAELTAEMTSIAKGLMGGFNLGGLLGGGLGGLGDIFGGKSKDSDNQPPKPPKPPKPTKDGGTFDL